MILRTANEFDIEALADMRWEHEYENAGSLNFSRERFTQAFSQFMKEGLNGNWVVWVAEEKGEIISNIFIRKIRKVPKPQKLFAEIAYVTNVHTKVTHRNMGVGTELLKKVKGWAAENNIELLFLWPSEKSVSFYMREGFSSDNEILVLETK